MADDQVNVIEHPKKRAWLVAYARTGNISTACKAAKVGRTTVWEWGEHDETFALEKEQALQQAGDLLEQYAREWATVGIKTVKEVYELDKDGALRLRSRELSREVSPTLLIFLLKGAKPEKYRERLDVNHSGAGIPMKVYAGFEPSEV